jgi:hypothetical protein
MPLSIAQVATSIETGNMNQYRVKSIAQPALVVCRNSVCQPAGAAYQDDEPSDR